MESMGNDYNALVVSSLVKAKVAEQEQRLRDQFHAVMKQVMGMKVNKTPKFKLLEGSNKNKKKKKGGGSKFVARRGNGNDIPFWNPRMAKQTEILTFRIRGVNSAGGTASAGGVLNSVWAADLSTAFTYTDVGQWSQVTDEYRVLRGKYTIFPNFVQVSTVAAATSTPVAIFAVDYANPTAAANLQQMMAHDQHYYLTFTGTMDRLHCPILVDGQPDMVWTPWTNLTNTVAYLKSYGSGFAANQLVIRTIELELTLECRQIS